MNEFIQTMTKVLIYFIILGSPGVSDSIAVPNKYFSLFASSTFTADTKHDRDVCAAADPLGAAGRGPALRRGRYSYIP